MTGAPGVELAGARALVTGAGGFVGVRLVAALRAAGADVHACVRPGRAAGGPALAGARVEEVDVADAAAVRRTLAAIAPDVVFNLAVARGDATPEQRARAWATNVDGAANLLAAVAERPRARLVQLGGPLEYGASDRPLRESDPPRPRTFYGGTKAAATALCRAAHERGVAAVVLRPFFVYGPGQRGARLIPAAIRAALDGAELPLTEPGLGRDWVFVDDVAEACVLAATAPAAPGAVINVATGVRTTNEQVVRVVQQATGRPIAVRPGGEPPRAWDRRAWVADVTHARELLGWRARHGMRAGIERTVAAALEPWRRDAGLAA